MKYVIVHTIIGDMQNWGILIRHNDGPSSTAREISNRDGNFFGFGKIFKANYIREL